MQPVDPEGDGLVSPSEATRAELAALRAAVALISHGASSGVVLEVIARHVAAALSPSYLEILRFEDENHVSVEAAWAAKDDGIVHLDRWDLDDDSLVRRIAQHRAPARENRASMPDDPASELVADRLAITCSVGVPILLGDQVWGALLVHSVGSTPLPPDAEKRLSGFNELIASVIADRRTQTKLRELAADQEALLRVAELVARGATPGDVFAAVAEELGRVLGVQGAKLLRYDPDDMATFVASWGPLEAGIPTGTRLSSKGTSVTGLIRATGKTARIDNYAPVSGQIGAIQRSVGMKTAMGAPIHVGGRLWGAVIVGSTGGQRLTLEHEHRIAKFADLIAIAMSNLETRLAQDALATEQAALRRVATAVAQEQWETMIPTILREIGQLLDVDGAIMLQYENQDTATLLAGWGEPSLTGISNARVSIRGDNPTSRVFRTGRPARQHDWEGARGVIARMARSLGVGTIVASPLIVENRLWGEIAVASMALEPLPHDTEQRLGQFSELVATAIGNMKARLDLLESRARIVRTADDTRRRFERDLHDGIQQRLVSVAMDMRMVQDRLPANASTSHRELSALSNTLNAAIENLRELSRGLHPAILSEGGLGPALRSLSRRSGVPGTIDMDDLPRLSPAIEVAAYYVVSEALANVGKHASAATVRISAEIRDGRLHVSVADNGEGGADTGKGSGLIGLQDRVEAVGGTLSIDSPRKRGTTITARFPLHVA